MKQIAFLIASVLVQPVVAADLQQIYHDAKSQDATFLMAQAAYQAGLERLPQGRAGLLPSASFSSNVSRNYLDIEGAALIDYNSRTYTLSLTQPLFRMQNWATFEQAKQQVLQAEAQFSAAQQDLILRVAQAYFDALLALENISVSRSQKTFISEQLAQAKSNFQVGTTTVIDVNETQARYDQIAAKEIADQNDLEIKIQALKELISKDPEQLVPLKDQLVLALPTPNSINDWVAASEMNNQTLVALRASVEMAKSEVQKQRAGRLPVVDVVASHNNSRNAVMDVFGNLANLRSSQIGIQLTLPLYAGGAIQSRIREALANQDRSNYEFEAFRRTVSRSVLTAFLGVTSGIMQVRALEQALKSSQASLDSTKLGYEAGVRTGLDVLNAEQQVSQARRDVLQVRYNVILSQLRLKAVTGKLNEADLAEVNALLAN